MIKKILKSRIFFFILGIVIAGSVGAYAVSVASSDVTYDNTTSGSSATTVKEAIDDLYSKVSDNTEDIRFIFYRSTAAQPFMYDKDSLFTASNDGFYGVTLTANKSFKINQGILLETSSSRENQVYVDFILNGTRIKSAIESGYAPNDVRHDDPDYSSPIQTYTTIRNINISAGDVITLTCGPSAASCGVWKGWGLIFK